MSKYTTEVRYICESKAGLRESAGVVDIDNILDKSWDKIFTSKCEFFDESYRSVLCKKILKHYYLREIGCETAGIWALWVNTRLEEIMPYYNQLYKSELLHFEPFNDVDVTRTHNEIGKKNINNVGTSKNISKFNDTPQGGLSGIESDKYLTSVTIDDNRDNLNSTQNDDRNFTEKYIGKQGTRSYSDLLMEFRRTMLNIDMQVIKEFEDLFMLLW